MELFGHGIGPLSVHGLALFYRPDPCTINLFNEVTCRARLGCNTVPSLPYRDLITVGTCWCLTLRPDTRGEERP